jgi:hypothetical protein
MAHITPELFVYPLGSARRNSMDHFEQEFHQRVGQFPGSQVAVGRQQSEPKRIRMAAEFERFFNGDALPVGLPEGLFRGAPAKLVTYYRQRAAGEPPRELRRHPPDVRHALLAALCWQSEIDKRL